MSGHLGNHLRAPTQGAAEDRGPQGAARRAWLSRYFRCSRARARATLLRRVPALRWVPRYRARELLPGDVVSGISTGVMAVPQGMAYALLAALPPVLGLYSSFYPPLVYFFFGTSRHISVGPFAVVSMMAGEVTERLAPDHMFTAPNSSGAHADPASNATAGSLVDEAARDAARARVATALALLTGAFQVALGLLRFGVVATYLSEPLVRGFSTAASVTVLVSQLKHLLGLALPRRHDQVLGTLHTARDVCRGVLQVNVVTALVSLLSLCSMLLLKRVVHSVPRLRRVPVPAELLLVVLGTVLSEQLQLSPDHSVDVVGLIPSGLAAPEWPSLALSVGLVGDALALAVVGYTVAVSLGKMFAQKHGYTVDGTQELLALGLSNVLGAFFGAFPIACSMSRSLLQENSGGHTQVAGLVASLVVLVSTLSMGRLLEPLPRATLAAIIVVNLRGMFCQFGDLPVLWRTSRADFAIWLVSFVAVVLLGLDLGLAASVAFSLLTVIVRTQRPRYSLLGKLPDCETYCDIENNCVARELPGVKIFRANAALYFANVELYVRALVKKTGLLEQARAPDRRCSRHRAHGAPGNNKVAPATGDGAQMPAPGAEPGLAVEPAGRECALGLPGLPGLPGLMAPDTEDRAAPRPAIHSLILDFSPVNLVDTVAVKTLKTAMAGLGAMGLEVCIAACQGDCVLEQLHSCGFFTPGVTETGTATDPAGADPGGARLFPSVHAAAVHCLQRGRSGVHTELG
ncbi:prestin-like [Lethenteron reissneri]|uniref:prestin-like n=1 Tax=Lethenteron reissneri TaxID=7753 RepID=UPI002AB642D1|nr:prestin-like [Lethenteron reissneri]